MRRPIASVEFFETCLEIGVNRALVCRAAGRVAGIETENPSLRNFRSDYGRSAPHARLTRYRTFSGIDRPLAFGKAWPASRRNIGVGQLVRWGVQRFYGGRQAIRTVGDWIKKPREQVPDPMRLRYPRSRGGGSGNHASQLHRNDSRIRFGV
jgi:hypothetical protein